MWYVWLANGVLVLHVSYVLFVVLGLLWTWLGLCRGWRSARSPWFRGVHLLLIAIVVFETWWGITCPLTTLENEFRKQAGQSIYEGDWIAIWLHSLLFLDFTPAQFTVAYTLFGVAVLGTLIAAPPRWNRSTSPAGESNRISQSA